MPSFLYKARDGAGQLISGNLEAENERAAALSLTRLGYNPIRIERQSVLKDLSSYLPWKRGHVDRQEILILLRELSVLLRSGIPLATSLEGVVRQTPSPALHQILDDITRRVQGGASFSEALGKYPKVFPNLFTSMIRVGETAGILDQVLERLSQMGSQELETKTRLMSAMIYPLVLVGFAFILLNGLLIGVLPRFVTVFEASQVKLPWPTRFLLALSGIMRHYWWLVGAGLVALGVGFKRFYASPAGHRQIDRLLLNLPGFGILYRKILIERLTRTLGGMLRTGVPLLEALNVTEQTLPNLVFQDLLKRTRTVVAEGQSLVEPWQASGLFPPLVLQLVSVGEKTGQLDAMLNEVATFYEPEIDISIRKFTTLLEPVLLMGMGLMVGFIALSVLLPIFQLVRVFRK